MRKSFVTLLSNNAWCCVLLRELLNGFQVKELRGVIQEKLELGTTNTDEESDDSDNEEDDDDDVEEEAGQGDEHEG